MSELSALLSQQSAAPAPRRAGVVGPGVLAALTSLVAIWSYTGAIMPGAWTFVVVLVVAVTLIVGILCRAALARLRPGLRELITGLVQAVALVVAGSAMLNGAGGSAGLLPTRATVRVFVLHLQQAAQEIANGTVPIATTPSIAVLMGLVFIVVSVLIDLLLANRVIMLTILLSSLVGVMPMLMSLSAVNIVWFVMQAVVILLILRFGARRDHRATRQPPYILAVLSGALVVGMTVVATPVLPMASARWGTGPALTVTADLRLGDDLRRPGEVEALTLITTAAKAPYLRLATLSRFDGEVWRPDRSDRLPLSDGFGEREWPEEIKTIEHDVSIRVLGVSSDRLPVPYAAESVQGAGNGWQLMRENRTVLSRTRDAAGADYTVKMAVPEPTLEQIRAASATGAQTPEPREGLPPIIGQLARQLTADTTNDYDRMIALQDWFRTEFSYSLDAPVDEGFDGTGADAVATFLEKRTGYCVHFAGAFALMAQTLDVPVRIVVGYLPGTATDEKVDDSTVYSVSSDRLHSWPEVHFEGIGWVPFEPTATLGNPTQFISAAGGEGTDGPIAPEPTVSATNSASAGPSHQPGDEQNTPTGAPELRRLDPAPVVLVGFGIVFVALLPAIVRRLRRMHRTRLAGQGDAMAAWREITDTLIDLGWPVGEADTARMRAAQLVEKHGAPQKSVGVLIDAVERRSYSAQPPPAVDLAAPLRQVLPALSTSVDRPRRVLGAFAPASLFTSRRAQGPRSRAAV